MKTLYSIILLLLLLSNNAFSQSIRVPVDHNSPNKGTFELEYEFGAEYNPNLPTVIVVADAQQFYVRKGNIKRIQEDLFGEKFNVLGIIPRNNVDKLIERTLDENGEIYWKKAYLLFNSFQYANDIELIRKKLLSDQREVYLYGTSGGAYLVTEYLSVFPQSPIKKVFVAAVANSIIQRELGIINDKFQRDFIAHNHEAKKKLEKIFSENYYDRELISRLFQRQNFFVELESLDRARIELIDKLYRKDMAYVDSLKEAYQINILEEIFNTDRVIPIRVRIFEFIAPLLDIWQYDESTLYPDLENSLHIAEPLVELYKQYGINFSPVFNQSMIRDFQGYVFILSGRYDHTVDYRSSIYLAGLLKNSHLLIVEDDHIFRQLKSDSAYSELIQDFYLSCNEDINWLKKYEKYRWMEK